MSEPAPAGVPAVVFYWRPGCAFCWTLRRSLRHAGVTLEERNIWEDPSAAAFVRSVARGNETVPTIVVAGKALVNPPASAVFTLLSSAPDRPPAAPPPTRGWLRRALGRREPH